MKNPIYWGPDPAPMLLMCLVVALLSACGAGGAPEATVTGGGGASRSAQVAVAKSATQTVRGKIFGLRGTAATVTLGNQADVLFTTLVDANGNFEFAKVPYGEYFVKAEARGLAMSPPQGITVNPPTVLESFGALSKILPVPTGVVFTAASTTDTQYSFHWDTVSGGHEAKVHINTPPVITFRSEALTLPDNAAAASLYKNYGIVLSDADATWSNEYAARLLTTLDTMLASSSTYFGKKIAASKWILTNKLIADDITIERGSSDDVVTISTAAFTYATPRLVHLDGVPGRYFSKRLFQSAVRFYTYDGADADKAEYILNTRYQLFSKQVYYSFVTATTTREGDSKFAPFKPAEWIDLITSLEEMPEGFFKIPGLTYLVRRAYGQTNPSNSAMVVQSYTDAAYIEFTDKAFVKNAATTPQRVILHAKSHFLWAKVLSEKLKNAWLDVGGWYRNPANLNQWLNKNAEDSSTAYGHSAGPDEDMAEALTDYMLNPAALQARAYAKFTFIKDRVFYGDRFVPVIREDLTFTVVDLVPDYVIPGKVKAIDITLRGGIDEPKAGSIDLELFGDSSPSAGARECSFNLVSPSGDETKTLRSFLFGRKATGDFDNSGKNNYTKLGFNLYFSKSDEAGYWRLNDVACTDVTGNTRYLKRADYGSAVVYVNNRPPPDKLPRYVPGSLSLKVIEPLVVDGHTMQQVQLKFSMPADAEQSYAYLPQLVALDTGGKKYYSLYQKFGHDTATEKTVTFVIPDYYPSGRYVLPELSIKGYSGAMFTQKFPDPSVNEPLPTVTITNTNTDSGKGPELDVNRITLTATPFNPAVQDGQTIVKMVFYVRDDAAGLSNINFFFRDPQGNSLVPYLYTNATPGMLEKSPSRPWVFVIKDPTAWQRYEATIILPAGSAPGVWGLAAMSLYDMANFSSYYNFTEIMHFTVTR